MAQVTSQGKTITFGADVAKRILARTCEIAGLDADQARLLRLGENALFHLPAKSLVVRIARTMDYWSDVVKEVDVGRWLEQVQFPAARVDSMPQPVEVDGHPVTFWLFISGRNVNGDDIAHLGALLRRLHKLPAPAAFDLPAEDILGRVQRRIGPAAVPSSDKDFLLNLLSELAAELPNLRYPLCPAPTHGDAHVQNLMVREGQFILIDFERFAWGQPEWDLSMTATEHKTAGWWTDAEYAKFVEAYGYDVTSWADGFPVLRAVHEIKMTTWLMQNVSESQEIASEYENRMRTIRGQALQEGGWRPF